MSNISVRVRSMACASSDRSVWMRPTIVGSASPRSTLIRSSVSSAPASTCTVSSCSSVARETRSASAARSSDPTSRRRSFSLSSSTFAACTCVVMSRISPCTSVSPSTVTRVVCSVSQRSSPVAR